MDHEITPPDGGWGWMVVLGAALINMVNQALFSVFGLIFGEQLKEMANGKATGITLVMAVSVCVTNFSGLMVGPLMRQLSVRTITIFGIFCVGSGMVLSSFATEIWHIVISYGIFTGLGLGLVASSTFLAINGYFTKRKSTAVGLSMAGTSTGQMIMPIFVGILLKKYQFTGTTFILGILSYSGIIGALFFKPIFCCKRSLPEEVVTEQDIMRSQCELNFNSQMLKEKEARTIGHAGETQTLLNKNGNSLSREAEKQMNAKDAAVNIPTNKPSETDRKPSAFLTSIRKIVSVMDLKLLTDFTFVHLLIGLGLGYVSSVSFSTFFPMFLQDEVNFTMIQTTTCMTALSAADIAGRLTISEICRKLNLGNRTSFMLGAVALAICRSCLVSLTDYKYILVTSIFVGYVRAVTVINQNLVISEYIQKERLPAAVGLNMVAKGIFIMSIGEPLGLLKDAFDYSICIHFLDVILILVASSWMLEYAFTKKLCSRRSISN